MNIIRLMVAVAVLPGIASAFSWVPKSSSEERAGFIAAARAAGEAELADRIAVLDDAAWIDPAIRAGT